MRMHGIALSVLLNREAKTTIGSLGEKRNIKHMNVFKKQGNYIKTKEKTINGNSCWNKSEGLTFKETMVIGFVKRYLTILRK